MSNRVSALAGRTVVVTRPLERVAPLAERLEEAGAEVLLAPAIVVTPPDDWAPLDLAIERISQFQWVVFTSAQGVRSFVDRLLARGADVRSLAQARLAAIGRLTAEQLRRLGLRADLVPEAYRAEALAEALIAAGVAGHTVLVPRSAIARPVLVEALQRAGAYVDEVASYTIESAPELPPTVVEALRADGVDMVTFTSSSTVEHFVGLTAAAGVSERLSRVDVGCIGPITAETALRHSLHPQVVADEYTVEGLVAAIISFYRQRSSASVGS